MSKQWKCPECGRVNPDSREWCKLCGEPKPVVEKQPEPVEKGGPGMTHVYAWEPRGNMSGEVAAMTHIYVWGPRGNMPGAMSRKGEKCRLLARGAMNSALVEFADGYLAVISRNALRRIR